MRIMKGLFALTVIISCALSLNAFCQDPNEPDDSISDAKPLIVGNTPITHTIGYYGDQDWSVFFMVAGNTYSVRVENVHPSLDITLTITNQYGNNIDYKDERDAGQNETYTTTPTSDGFLYVITQSYDPSIYGTNITYSIRVTMDAGEGHGWVYNAGETFLDLQWTPCTSPGLTGYNILRSTSFLNLLSYNLINATLIPQTTTTYHDSGLTPNTTYYYRVMSRTGLSDTEHSGIFAGITQPMPTPTPTPTPTPSPTPIGTPVIHVKDYTCPSSENWIRYSSPDGTFINAYDGSFYISTHSTQGCFLGIDGNATNNVYGLWQCPGNDMSYVPNNVYRVKYTIHTTQSDQGKVPNIRMLSYCGSPSPPGNPDFAVAGGNRLGKGAAFSPTIAPQTYNIYFGPPDLSGNSEVKNFRFSFELLDFDLAEEGTDFVDEVAVERFPTPAKSEGSLVNTILPPFAGWVSDSNPGNIYEPVTVSSDPTLGISIESPGPVPTSGKVNYGQWRFDTTTNIFYTANVLYRCVYTISAPTSTATTKVAKIRVINNNSGNSWSSEIDLDPYVYYTQMPTPGGSEFSVWFETLPKLFTGADISRNMMTFIFDIMDGNDNQAGKVTLSKIELYTYPIP